MQVGKMEFGYVRREVTIDESTWKITSGCEGRLAGKGEAILYRLAVRFFVPATRDFRAPALPFATKSLMPFAMKTSQLKKKRR